MALNQFSDLTWEEIQSTYLTLLPPPSNPDDFKVDNLRQDPEDNQPFIGGKEDEQPFIGAGDAYPSGTCTFVYDFSKKNATINNSYVYPVKNQGSCGSCYAFSGMAPYTALVAKKYNKEFLPSIQQIVSCTTTYGNGGCGGGWFTGAYAYTKVINIATEATYPYTSTNNVTGTCQNSTRARGPYKVSGYSVSVGSTAALSCTAMLTTLKTNPISVALYVDTNFMKYGSGVFPNSKCIVPSSISVNHGVYLVGFDSCNNWKVQNSWGTGWGEVGFIRL